MSHLGQAEGIEQTKKVWKSQVMCLFRLDFSFCETIGKTIYKSWLTLI